MIYLPKRYFYLSLLGVFLMFLLIVLQINWFTKSIHYQQKEDQFRLKKMIPNMALKIDAINHNLFHQMNFKGISVHQNEINRIVDSILVENRFSEKVYYSIYQSAPLKELHSNTIKYNKELLGSDITCNLSSIVSFSVLKKSKRREGETDNEYMNRTEKERKFQYFSPVEGLNQKENQVYLSLYYPSKWTNSLLTLFWQFIVTVLILILLFLLLIYLLVSLSRHKKISQVKEDFFNNLTHEFKLPLGSINLASKVLRNSDDREKNESYHHIIERESKLLETQIDKLLQISMFEGERSEDDFEKIDVHEILESMPDKLKISIEKKKALITVELYPREAYIKGDRDLLTSCFLNLLENSLKYSQDGLRIEIKSKKEGKKVLIKIIDNGPGIDPRYEKQIFDRFFRANKGNQYKGKGFGIGLSYVRSIIKAHKGRIELINHYPKGCEFQIRL